VFGPPLPQDQRPSLALQRAALRHLAVSAVSLWGFGEGRPLATGGGGLTDTLIDQLEGDRPYSVFTRDERDLLAEALDRRLVAGQRDLEHQRWLDENRPYAGARHLDDIRAEFEDALAAELQQLHRQPPPDAMAPNQDPQHALMVAAMRVVTSALRRPARVITAAVAHDGTSVEHIVAPLAGLDEQYSVRHLLAAPRAFDAAAFRAAFPTAETFVRARTEPEEAVLSLGEILGPEENRTIAPDAYVLIDHEGGSPITRADIAEGLATLLSNDALTWVSTGRRLPTGHEHATASQFPFIVIEPRVLHALGIPATPYEPPLQSLGQLLLNSAHGKILERELTSPLQPVEASPVTGRRMHATQVVNRQDQVCHFAPVRKLSAMGAIGPASVPYMDEALHSLVRQEPSAKVEACFQFDGSHKDALQLGVVDRITALAHERPDFEIRFGCNGRRLGAALTRNNILKMMTGDAMTTFDLDDMAADDAFDRIVVGFNQNPNVAYIMGRSRLWRPDSDGVHRIPAGIRRASTAGRVGVSAYLVPAGDLPPLGTDELDDPVFALRLDVALSLGGWAALRVNSDYALAERVAATFDGLAITNTLRLHREHDGQITHGDVSVAASEGWGRAARDVIGF
jgi:hypothetical protein